MRRLVATIVFGSGLALGAVVLEPSGAMKAQAPAPGATVPGYLRGGAHGTVKTPAAQPIGGLMVQVIAVDTSIRTTVYTDDLGQYEFPRLAAGSYTLRIARPIEFKAYRKDNVRIDGATTLPDIVLDRVTKSEFLPPTPNILPQLSEAEWLVNMPGTAQEKKAFVNACGGSCHGFQMQMRARFDEAGWRKIVNRMGYQERLLVMPPGTAVAYDPETKHYSYKAGNTQGRRNEEGAGESESGDDRFRGDEKEMVIKWLARVRGPAAEDPPIKPFARPTGASTHAVITEYELPWSTVNIHDVYGDASGNVWFTVNRSPFIGKLDPKTGKVTSYRTPTPDGMHPGSHWIQVAKDGTVWYSDTWSRSLARFDPKTGKFGFVYTAQHGNVGLSPDGLSIWHTDRGKIKKWDTATVMETGAPVKQWPLPSLTSAYGNFLSRDGKYFAGGGSKIVWMNTETGEVREAPALSGSAGSGRGDFDPDGNVWVGSKSGFLVKYDPKANVVSEYAPPTLYANFYTARVDKNGEVWAGEMHGGKIARFNPRTQQWIEYVLPTAWSQDYHSWVDNSTNPVTYWYGDQYGYIVRVQPR